MSKSVYQIYSVRTLASICWVLFCGKSLRRFTNKMYSNQCCVALSLWLFAAVLPPLTQADHHHRYPTEDVYGASDYYIQNPWRTNVHRSAGCVCRPQRECPYFLVDFAESCGLHRFEPFVCCGFDADEIRRRRDEQDERFRYHQRKIREDLERRRYDQDTDTPWVWDVEPTVEAHHVKIKVNNRRRPHHHSHWDAFRFDEEIDDEKIEEYHRQSADNGVSNHHQHWLFHFEDPHTMLNHPPSISEEFAIPDHLAEVEMVVSQPAGLEANVDGVKVEVTTSAPTTTTTAQPPANVASGTNILNDPSCGISISNRIIGGQNAVAMQFPWIARLAYRNRSKFFFKYYF